MKVFVRFKIWKITTVTLWKIVLYYNIVIVDWIHCSQNVLESVWQNKVTTSYYLIGMSKTKKSNDNFFRSLLTFFSTLASLKVRRNLLQLLFFRRRRLLDVMEFCNVSFTCFSISFSSWSAENRGLYNIYVLCTKLWNHSINKL